MGVFQSVANWVLGEYKVRTTQATDGAQLQHVRLDIGVGTAEETVTSVSGLPVTGVPEVTFTDLDATVQIPWPCAGVTTGDAFAPKVVVNGIDSGSGAALPIVGTYSAPSGGEVGLVTRNIPSGTQAVSGTVTILGAGGAPISSVEDQIQLTGQYGPTVMGYDPSLAQFGPIPLTGSGAGVSVALANAAAVLPDPRTVTGSIVSATSTITLLSLTGYGGVSVEVRGTYTGVNFLLEGSNDGTNWSTISMSRQDTPQLQQSTGVIASVIRSWIAPTMGMNRVRVRATAWASGTATVTINGSLASIPTAVQTLPSGTQTVSGTVTATVANATASLIGAKAAGCAVQARYLDLNSTGVLVQTGQTYANSLHIHNEGAATVYVKVYNKATAATSADTPTQVYGVATKGSVSINLGIGLQLSLGYSLRATTGFADADTTNPAANTCIVSTSCT